MQIDDLRRVQIVLFSELKHRKKSFRPGKYPHHEIKKGKGCEPFPYGYLLNLRYYFIGL